MKRKNKTIAKKKRAPKPKILFVTEELYPRDKGGIAKLLFDLADHIAAEFEVHFLLLKGSTQITRATSLSMSCEKHQPKFMGLSITTVETTKRRCK